MSEESGSQGCVLVVASYSDIFRAIGAPIDDTVDRISMSPTLSDFIELRAADLGRRPKEDTVRPDAVTRIADELTRQISGVSRTYFGLVVIDADESDAARLLTACQADPTIAALPLRLRGLAAHRDLTGETGFEIAVPRSGVWTQQTMVASLRDWADALLLEFSSGNEPGLDTADLLRLRKSAGFSLGTPDDPVILLQEAKNRSPAEIPPLFLGPQQAAPSPRRWLPWSRGARHRPPAHLPAGPCPRMLVHLAVAYRPVLDDKALWKRGCALMVALDQALAARMDAAFQVRILSDPARLSISPPEPAGRLTTRRLRRPDLRPRFSALFAELSTAVHRDLQSGEFTPPATVVLYSAAAPVPDPAALRSHGELAEMARVVWVAPPQSHEQTSQEYAGMDVLRDSPEVIDALMALIKPG
ncbi:hypothetical protein FXF51_46710 [Nonomuraea sp. PA05]|uniref:hypothetical protein n=1 Tax=Nonomuraea sp. PA05 TaxID=2604466 RepID=UPI0011DA651B|nr:hypothetical protein [Nonomuraea sp. PA05]TYB54737.1 hypothetical protein FXF51_46710 [Nonomuraea sp. PA05]